MITPRRLALVALLLALGVALATLPAREWLLALVVWIRALGPWGALVYVVAYVAAAVLLLPGALLTAAAGFAYGPIWGTLLASPASVLAGTLAFRLGRGAARERVAARVARDPRFAAIDAAVGHDGFRIVTLLRLSPLFPYNFANYALGLTRLRTRDFVLGSWLGMLPGTALYVYLGSLATSPTALGDASAAEGSRASSVLYWGGLLATLAVTVLVTRIARRALARTIPAVPLEIP